MTVRSDGPSHWAYFNWPEVIREAKARLEQARSAGKNAGEMDTLEYWCAWCAHANASACLLTDRRLSERSGDVNPNPAL